MAWGEQSINVSHSDILQAWGSDFNLMKLMAGKGQSPVEKKKQIMKTVSLYATIKP